MPQGRLRAVILVLAFLAACLALFLTDRVLCRTTGFDDLFGRGSTGISWLDEVLAKRAAQQQEKRHLLQALKEARGTTARLSALDALAQFESRSGRPNSGLRLKTLRAITEEGRTRPETVEAWKELLQRNRSHEPDEETGSLFESYVAAVGSMPAEPSKLIRLLDTWKLSQELHRPDLEDSILHNIDVEFPRSIEAIPAYEALATRRHAEGDSTGARQAESSAAEGRKLILRQEDERQLISLLQQEVNRKDSRRATETFLQLSPDLLPAQNYWSLFTLLLPLVTEREGLSTARTLLSHAVVSLPRSALTEAQQATLFTSAALAECERGRLKESAALLNRVPSSPPTAWRPHLAQRLWAAGPPSPLPSDFRDTTAEIPKTSPAGDTKKWSPWFDLKMLENNKVSVARPSTRWRATRDDRALHLEIECAEPEPSRIVLQGLPPDHPDLWKDDCVEIFLAAARGEAAYGQWIINARGVLTDALLRPRTVLLPLAWNWDTHWNSGARVAAFTTPDGWRIRAAIPWSCLGIRMSDNACFLNLRRQRRAGGKLEIFSWSEKGFPEHGPQTQNLLLLSPSTTHKKRPSPSP